MRFINSEKQFIGKMEASDYEAGFLGRVDTGSEEYKKALKEVKKPSRAPEKLQYYVSYVDSLKLARAFQPRDLETRERVDPTNPKAELLRELRVFLLDILEKFELDEDLVKAYTAVGTPADFIHGVDAFIDVGNQTVTLDITLRKGKTGKANIIIDEELADPKVDEDKFLEQVDKIAKQIYQKLDKEKLTEFLEAA